jgi:molybdopterin synthase catalytic subunit
MSAKMELRWLKEDDYQGASQKFIGFCKEDIFQQAKSDPTFDFEIYESSIRLILEKLDQVREQRIQGVR